MRQSRANEAPSRDEPPRLPEVEFNHLAELDEYAIDGNGNPAVIFLEEERDLSDFYDPYPDVFYDVEEST